MASAKEKILDVAEQLFAAKGVGGTSLRSIITAAEVNQASVHYHFGSKEALVKEVVERRIGPLNSERLAILDALEQAAGHGPLNISDVVAAYVGPALRLSQDEEKGGATFMKLLGRFYHESDEWSGELLQKQFAGILQRFSDAMKKCLPEMSRKAFAWRFQFLIGALGYAMCERHLVEWIGQGEANAEDPEEAIAHLVEFALVGMGVPPPSTRRGSEVTQ